MPGRVLAIDFGTSNSAVAVLENGAPRRLRLEAGADTLPTSVFFPSEGGMLIGTEANAALIEGDEGRYMRALKSILGTQLFHEKRTVGGKRQTLADVVTAFIAEVNSRAEAETGERFRRVLSGRPVHFHSSDAERDARAEDDLRACYHAAGFEAVNFLYEPEAAARACSGLSGEGRTGLIVDIGGGTSDFSVFRTEQGRVEILASHGIRLGGTDFDRQISIDHAMPLLGLGGQMRRTFGAGLLPVPNAIYRDLADWAQISFIYSRDTERRLQDMLQHAVETEKVARLQHVIENRLGHELAFVVEAGKIAANADGAETEIGMTFIEDALAASVTAGTLQASLENFGTHLREAIAETLRLAGAAPPQVQTAILVGGSSLMSVVSSALLSVCPAVDVQQSDAFTAVVDGLALATAEKS